MARGKWASGLSIILRKPELLKAMSENRFHYATRTIAAVLSLWLFPSFMNGQTASELRDSLKQAADRLAFHPDSTDLRLKKAAFNIRLEQWQYALEEYDYILARDKYNPAALFYRAYVNEKLSRDNFARLDYERLLTVVPGHFEAQLGLALLNQKDKRFTEALDQINRLVGQYPHNAVGYAARAGIEREQKMYGLAAFDFEEAMKLDPDNIDYALDHIDVLISNGELAAARKELLALQKKGVPQSGIRRYFERLKGK